MADLDVDVDHGVVMGLVRQMSVVWEDVVCECVEVGGCVRKSGGVEELWRRVWLDKEEEERREEKRDDNSLIPPFPLLLLTFYTSFFSLLCSNSFFFVKRCAEFAITGYSWCVGCTCFTPNSTPFSSISHIRHITLFLHLTLLIGDTTTITTRHLPHTLLS